MAMKDLVDRFNAGEHLGYEELDQLRMFYEGLEGRLRRMVNAAAPTEQMIKTHGEMVEKLARVNGMLRPASV